MKKTLSFIIFSIIAVLIYFGYKQFLAYKNVKNSKEINIGIPKEEMLKIMGEPKAIHKAYLDSTQIIYFYEPPFAASEGIDIYIDSTNRVSRITYFE